MNSDRVLIMRTKKNYIIIYYWAIIEICILKNCSLSFLILFNFIFVLVRLEKREKGSKKMDSLIVNSCL